MYEYVSVLLSWWGKIFKAEVEKRKPVFPEIISNLYLKKTIIQWIMGKE